MTELLETPLEWAERFVRSDSLLKSQWEYLRALYVEEVRGRPPFGGDLTVDDALEFKTLRALLGGETGAVAQVRRAAGEERLSAEAEAWLAKAEGLSAMFFEPGSDEPRPVKFRLELNPEAYPAKEFEKNFRLEEVKLEFAQGVLFEWTSDDADERKRPISLELVGPAASEFSSLKGTVAQRQGFLGRKIGGKWQPGEGVDAVLPGDATVKARAEGTLAPLKLLAMGWQEGGILRYAFEVPWKKDKPGRIEVSFIVSGDELERLLHLLREGLEAPPASPKAS
jgi:hypothetical protein